MNKYDRQLLAKLIEKRQSNSSTDNSVIIIFKTSNKMFVKDEHFKIDKTSSNTTLENRLKRLFSEKKISYYEKQGDGKTFKVLIDFPKTVSKRRKKISLSKSIQMSFAF